jgi:hypothetical protein
MTQEHEKSIQVAREPLKRQADRTVAAESSGADMEDERQRYLSLVTKNLVQFTGASLLVLAILIYGAQALWTRSFLVLIVFGAGLVGGFVSLQQRLPKASVGDLRRLSESWAAVLLVPINGGIFAIVLHVAFLGKIVDGALFPHYLDVAAPASRSGVKAVLYWLRNVAPAGSADLGKLIFWAFVAGFSERLVPQILQEKAGGAQADATSSAPGPGERQREN